jgi:hypothetical protein
MPRFRGTYEETFTVATPPEVTRAHFASLEAIVANYGPLRSHRMVDHETLELVLVPQADKGVEFAGAYTCRYVFTSENVLEWSTIRTENLWSSGRAVFRAAPGGGTTVAYSQQMEAEMKVNALLGRIIAPIVSGRIRDGVKTYLQRMRASLPVAS